MSSSRFLAGAPFVLVIQSARTQLGSCMVITALVILISLFVNRGWTVNRNVLGLVRPIHRQKDILLHVT